jgi:adenine-specific DNA-methyltransferase
MIGSKKSLLEDIVQIAKGETVIDVFTGTTRVAQAFKKNGYRVYTSDLAWASEAYAYTFIANEGPNKHLQSYIDELNSLEPVEDWITNNYCDVKGKDGGVVKVWQPKNGAKADAIRDKIEEYNLEHWEKMTLITSLIFALDKVDNTVGVQQAYLKDWCNRSYNDLKLELPNAIESKVGIHYIGDALEIDYPPADTAYLDPPYSGHSYSTYYHIWDSIVRWDKPDVGLKTNRRIDRVRGDKKDSSMDSKWNRKGEVLDAFSKLISKLDVSRIIISYNDESLVSKEDMVDMCGSFGKLEIEEIDYKRNIMSTIGNARLYKDGNFKTDNKELLFVIDKRS